MCVTGSQTGEIVREQNDVRWRLQITLGINDLPKYLSIWPWDFWVGWNQVGLYEWIRQRL
jgi:hypothetical protein